MITMPSRGWHGVALLVAGYGTPNAESPGLPLRALGQIGEALLAADAGWRVRRLSSRAGERETSDRPTLKRYIDELADASTSVAVLVGRVVIDTTRGEPVLLAGGQHRRYPDDATLPLAWIEERLRVARAKRLLVALSVDGVTVAEAPRLLAALRSQRPSDVIAVAVDNGSLLEVLCAGLCGAALDASVGTVTMRSISEHLTRAVPGIALQVSHNIETLTASPPFGGPWGERRPLRAIIAPRRVLPPVVDDAQDLSGSVLPGRFRIERRLALSRTGAVYAARQMSVERDVAIKVLHPGIDPGSDEGRLFVHEIKSVGRLDHVNVVRIYQADITLDGRLFFAMELLRGRDLQRLVNEEGTLAPTHAIALVRQLLCGLGAAHEAGLVHADIKPGNAFLTNQSGQERLVLLDFGLARLRPPGQPAESVGGTLSYMAPEQLRHGRIDARSDLFSAALVIVTLLTGWRRQRAEELVPPLDAIADATLRKVLTRALALDPAARFQTAADFLDALQGKFAGTSHTIAALPPFHHLASLTERDRDRFFGRDRDLAALTDQVLFRRVLIYTSPSGVGKTSLLRAGLVPRLEALGVHAYYLACRPGAHTVLPSLVWPGATQISDAIARWHESRREKLVILIDQLDTLLSIDVENNAPDGDAATLLLREVLNFTDWPADGDVSIVLTVREDFLAQLISRSSRFDEGIPVLRLGPLSPAGAREAIVGPLMEQRLTIAPALVDALVGDLEAAARAIAPEMGWGRVRAIYPPHLQLACSVLYEAISPGETELTEEHYRRLGGFDAIVGEYLDRVMETELDAPAARIARDLFLTLVTSAHMRALRGEAELLEILGSRHERGAILAVLGVLRERGLLVRVASGDEPSWELAHDSLVPRVLSWIDRRDLDRRRVLELVRHHLRHSQPRAPSLLGRAELREIRTHRDVITELECEWARRGVAGSWTPARLIARSYSLLRRQTLVIAAVCLVLTGSAGFTAQRWGAERTRRQREEALRDRDLGRFVLELAPFDWDAVRHAARPVPPGVLALTWRLHETDEQDDVGVPFSRGLVTDHGHTLSADGLVMRYEVEARGGSAFLVVDGRGRAGERCPPSTVPLRALPGYARRERANPILRVYVPTCQTTRTSLVTIPAGAFVYGGVGTPPSAVRGAELETAREEIVSLGRFAIDRTEVTNASFDVFAKMRTITGIAMPAYIDTPELHQASTADRPVAGVSWEDARAYCRFLGKELPTSAQWEKAMRGGLTLADGRPNPMPRRNLPWGTSMTHVPAQLKDSRPRGTAPVGSIPGDVSPYGVLDLAGNIQEWTISTPVSNGMPLAGSRITRGGNWENTSSMELVDFMAIENPRPVASRSFTLGVRCVLLQP